MKHRLPVWLIPHLCSSDVLLNGDEVCEQGYADLKMGGINERVVRRIRRKK